MKRYGKLFDSGHWLDAQWWYPEADFLQLGESYDAQGIAYNALAAELAEVKLFLADEKAVRRNAEAELADARKHLDSAYDALDYFGHSPPYDGSQAKANQARIRELEAALRGARDTLREIEPMVDHVYSLNRIRISEKECVAALAPVETPVSTLCAVCDQIKELHPNTHPWTAKETDGKRCTCDNEDPFKCKCRESSAACHCVCHGL